MYIDINETDWKLYRSRLANWQEAFMEKICKEYISILQADKNASNRFWELHDRLKEDSAKTGVVARKARSSMIHNILNLLQESAITDEDLEGFSDKLVERIKFMQDNFID
ncbi:MAG: multidrug transporter [Ruminococcus flavefaciens]|nr:multidrug transporter [Ruminococcus flavefaciens]MCM1362918.1 multidrug transporter [Clostridiales bacterium]